MTTLDQLSAPGPGEDRADEHTDPRWIRSRNRLIDAATTLLASGGVEAVTIDAVTRISKVARTTLYRHFDGSADLLVAAFERLLPRVVPPAPEGPLREQILELLDRQAGLIEEAPVHLTALAWMALGSAAPADEETTQGRTRTPGLGTLRARVVSQYRQPFDALLGHPDARKELGEFDVNLAIAQLLGPVVFVLLAGLPALKPADRARIVDDFFAAHRPRLPGLTSDRTRGAEDDRFGMIADVPLDSRDLPA